MARHRMSWRITGVAMTAALILPPAAAYAIDRSEQCPELEEIAAENDPQNCRPIWAGVGLPVSPADAGICITTVCHAGFITGHNDRLKVPEWVIERLTRDMVTGPNTRPKIKFKSEAKVQKSAAAADRDYAKSGFDRGHQAASADFSISAKMMADTFVLSNAVPQVGQGFNRGVWRELEMLTRVIAENRDEIFVVTGPIHHQTGAVVRPAADACGAEIAFTAPSKAFICDANDTKKEGECKSGVAVPIALYKIIYDPKLNRVNAYILPNVDHRKIQDKSESIDYLQRYRTSVKSVEDLTGLTFFADMTRRQRNIAANGCGTTMRH